MNIFMQQEMVERMNAPIDREKPRANLYNVVKRLRENTSGHNHTIVVSKLNDIHMKGKHEEILTNFFNGM